MKKTRSVITYYIVLFLSVFVLVRFGSKLFDNDDVSNPQSGFNHILTDIVASESAYDLIPLVCYKSYENVAKIYPNINNKKIGIYIYEGDFRNEYGTETMAYFYRDSIFPLIVLNKNKIIGNDIEMTLTHELLHYVDYLKGGKGELWSKDSLSLDMVDPKISDPEYFSGKVFYVTTLNHLETIDKGLHKKESYKKLMKYIKVECDNFNRLKEYYESPEELFVRINLLKLKMFDYGIINQEDLNTLEGGLTKENIKKFIWYVRDIKIDASYYLTIYSLKWDWENEN